MLDVVYRKIALTFANKFRASIVSFDLENETVVQKLCKGGFFQNQARPYQKVKIQG